MWSRPPSTTAFRDIISSFRTRAAADNRVAGRSTWRASARPPERSQIEFTSTHANGIPNISARDKDTGAQQQITISESSNLDRGEIERIVDLQFDELRRRLADRRMTMELTDEPRRLIAARGSSPCRGPGRCAGSSPTRSKPASAKPRWVAMCATGPRCWADAKADELHVTYENPPRPGRRPERGRDRHLPEVREARPGADRRERRVALRTVPGRRTRRRAATRSLAGRLKAVKVNVDQAPTGASACRGSRPCYGVTTARSPGRSGRPPPALLRWAEEVIAEPAA